MQPAPDLKIMDVRVDFFTTKQGGRQSAASGGEYRTIVRHEGQDHSCIVWYDENLKILTGQSFDGRMALLMQREQSKFKVGDPFALWEGKIFAVGVIQKL